MAANAKLFNRYIWLTELIYSAGRITREDINRRWAMSSLNEEQSSSIPERTFHRWKNGIEDLFHIVIACDKPTNTYFIENRQELAVNKTMQWLLHTFAVTNLINQSGQMRERILLETMPSDALFLTPILEAMRLQHALHVTYKKFGDDQPHSFTMQPYCVKAFKQRWYMVGCSSDHPNTIRVYALDRIQSMTVSDIPYQIPGDFDGKAYFKHFYGVWTGEEKPEKIVIQVAARDADYLRSLPLHPSQREIESNADYAVFEYYLAATFDFRQELLTYGSHLVVREPLWLANTLCNIGRDTMHNYKHLQHKK